MSCMIWGDAGRVSMKSKILIPTLIIIALIIIPISARYVFTRPIPIIEPGSHAAVLSIRYNWEDVTYNIDLDRVAEILRNYYVRRTFDNPFPSYVVHEWWSISLFRASDSVTISLGVDNVLYQCASDRIVYSIINPCELMYELSLLLTSQQQE